MREVSLVTVISAALFLIWNIETNVRVVTIQPNGPKQVVYPYSWISLFTISVALGILIFGITYFDGDSSQRNREIETKIHRVSAVLKLDSTLHLCNVLVSVELLGGQPRCYDFGCPASTLQIHNEVYATSIAPAISSIIAAGFGESLVRHKARESEPRKQESIA